ncbi:MAG: glycosyltransferase family 4 protein [Betaproteobacteria bacterium]|nr:glycosyltransferase family 4 protein [Betaproteobacteria bacterium]
MKICFYNVTASFIQGGLETYCWEAGRALARRGHRVSIVAGLGGEPRHEEVELLRFPFRREQEWPDLGTRFRRLMERISFGRHSLAHLVGAGYDAVVVNKPFDFPILWRARRRGLAAQTVFRSGGTEFYLGDRYFSRSVDHWLSTSRYNAAQVHARYGREVQVVHNGVDVDQFKPLARGTALRQRLGLPDSAQVLASVGRLVGWKGLRVILELLPQLPQDVHFLVMGEGPEQARLREQAAQLGLGARVHFCGRIAHDELPQVLAQADLLVQPSLGEESFGITLVEAMACALPVLASRQGGMTEIVLSGVTGDLLPPGEVEAWRGAIAALLQQPDRMRALGAAGRERVVAEFTWAANAAKLERLLQEGRAPCAAS